MKITSIGDIHGQSDWKEIIAQNKDTDLFIFLGDYFDAFDISAQDQISNFKDLIAYKKKNMFKVILLVGNHCLHYLKGINEHYSGYQPFYAFYFQELLHRALDEDLLQMCYIHDKFLFVHAGVTKTWCKENKIKMEDLEQSINDLFKYRPGAFRFNPDGWDDTGDDICQTPVWVRPASLIKDKINGYTQIVGHTVVKKINITEFGIILIDTLQTSGEYLQIIDGVPYVKHN